MLDRLMTTDELVKYLDIDLRTVYGYIKNKKFPAIKIGREWRFRKREVDQWMEENPRMIQRPKAGAGHVLVVDDDDDVRSVIARALSKAGYNVETAEDGAKALQMLRTGTFNLAVTDLKMPGMSGIQLIDEIRKYFPDLPAVIITAFSTKDSAIAAANLGCVGYLQKPLDNIEDAVKAVGKAIGIPAAAASV